MNHHHSIKLRRKIRRVLRGILVLVCAFSAFWILRRRIGDRREQEANGVLSEQAAKLRAEALGSGQTGEAGAAGGTGTGRGAGGIGEAGEETRADQKGALETGEGDAEAFSSPLSPALQAWYAKLHQQNGDFAGWLWVEGTNMDYPVVYTPEDQNKYLHLSFEGNAARSGTLFIATPWNEGTNHTLIYGHHMRNGSMLGQLSLYAEEQYGREHAFFRFDTLTETRVYELVGAFYGRIYSEGEEGFRYYEYPDLSSEEAYRAYVRQVKAASLYDTGIEPEYGEPLLTLSTCEYHVKNGRFAVVARMKKPPG